MPSSLRRTTSRPVEVFPIEDVVLVDTDVFSFIFRRDPRGASYRTHIEGRIAILSFQTVAELLFGAYMANWGQERVEALRDEMRKYAVADFDAEMAERWAEIRAERRSAGHEIPVADAWIAATALRLDCPIVTNNRRDFAGISGLQVITEVRA